jgi:hypothetical protein
VRQLKRFGYGLQGENRLLGDISLIFAKIRTGSLTWLLD